MAECRICEHKLTGKEPYCPNCGFPTKEAVSSYYRELQRAQQDRYAMIYGDFQESTVQLTKLADQIEKLKSSIGELQVDERKMKKAIEVHKKYIAQYESETEEVEKLLDILEYYLEFQQRQESLLQRYEHHPRDRRRISYSTRKHKIRIELDQLTEIPSILLILNKRATNRIIGPDAMYLRLDPFWKRHADHENVFIAQVPSWDILRGRTWYGHLSTQHNLLDQQVTIIGNEFMMEF